MLMYTNRSASREKLIEVHKKFEQAIEIKHEEKLSITGFVALLHDIERKE